MRAFFTEWWSVCCRLVKRINYLGRAYPVICSILAAFGVAAPIVFVNWRGSIELSTIATIAICLGIGVIFFLLLVTCLAAERAVLARVRFSSVKFDNEHRIIYIEIRNGEVPATLDIRVNSITDSLGRERLEHSWHGHWRGLPAKHAGRLTEFERAWYGVLAFGNTASGHPYLFIFTDDPVRQDIASEVNRYDGLSCVKVTQTLGAGENWPFTAEIVVVGETDYGTRRHLRTITFAIDRDASSDEFRPIVTEKSPNPKSLKPISKFKNSTA
jgi:hypothetical protein